MRLGYTRFQSKPVSRAITAFSVMVACVALSAGMAQAQSVITENFASQAEFQASALYTYIQGLLAGVDAHAPVAVTAVQQGSSEVPVSSAGAPGNATVTAEIQTAVLGAPTVLSGATAEASYLKQFLTLGNETGAGPTPYVTFTLPPVETGAAGGYNGYDIVIFDIGENLVSDVGRKNRERATFEVLLISQGIPFPAGTITNSGGDYINAILLDLTGVPGVPATIDQIRIIDETGTGNPVRESLDIDGLLRLNFDPATPTESLSWGRLKATLR